MAEEKKEMELSKEELAEVVGGDSGPNTCAGIVFACGVASPGILDFELAVLAMIF